VGEAATCDFVANTPSPQSPPVKGGEAKTNQTKCIRLNKIEYLLISRRREKMAIAKLCQNGRSQAVRLPKEI
jgi:hypothetical protein